MNESWSIDSCDIPRITAGLPLHPRIAVRHTGAGLLPSRMQAGLYRL
jgi:hypothetical protein